MRAAVFLPIFDELAEPATVATLAGVAEEAGWDGVFVWDHIAYRPPVSAVADPWVTMAAMACGTERVRLGPMVTPLPRRRPLKVAREAATLDRLSNGRLTLGVGIAGDAYRELSGTGEETDSRTRGRMLDEALSVLEAAWTGEEVDHHGDHYVVDKLRILPTPVQRPRPPIWVGVRYGNRAPLRRAARFEGVFPVAIEHPDQLAEVAAEVTARRRGSTGHGARALDEPFDVVAAGPPGADPAPFAAAGATWWLTTISAFETNVDTVRAVVADGPPTSSSTR